MYYLFYPDASLIHALLGLDHWGYIDMGIDLYFCSSLERSKLGRLAGTLIANMNNAAAIKDAIVRTWFQKVRVLDKFPESLYSTL